MDYVDWYCERVAPGFWGEPLNAVSNLAFVAGAIALLWHLHRARLRGRRTPVSVLVLAVELAAVGVFSGALHTTATDWAGQLDEWSIVVFIHTYVVCLLRWMWGVRWRLAWLAAPAYTLGSLGLLAAVEATLGEAATVGGYLPAIATQVLLTAAILLSRDPGRRATAPLMGAGTLTLLTAITARTIDQREHERVWALGEARCDLVLDGTHFLWHVFAGVTLYLITLALLRRAQQVLGTDPSAADHPDSAVMDGPAAGAVDVVPAGVGQPGSPDATIGPGGTDGPAGSR